MDYFVCCFSDLEEEKPYVIELEGLHTAVGVILSKGQIYAYENHCPHAGGPVCLGDVFGRIKEKIDERKMTLGEYVSQDESGIVCPWHGFEFDLKTGQCTTIPQLGLRKYSAYVKENEVYIQLGHTPEKNQISGKD